MGFGVSYLRPYDYENFTVGQSVEVLDEDIYLNKGTEPAAAAQKAMEAVISVENTAIRFRTDGGDPSATDGHLVASGAFITVSNLTAIKNFKAYAPADTATLHVTYYNS
jgi:hypothetical protein